MAKFTATSNTKESLPSILKKLGCWWRRKVTRSKSYWQCNTVYLLPFWLFDWLCLSHWWNFISMFLKTKENFAKSSFLCLFKQSGLAKLKSNRLFDLDMGQMILTNYLSKPLRIMPRGLWKPMSAASTSQRSWRTCFSAIMCCFGLNGLWTYPWSSA